MREKPDYVKITEALTEAKVVGESSLFLGELIIKLTVMNHRHPKETDRKANESPAGNS